MIGRSKFALSRASLRALSDAGCDIAAHGCYHEYLTHKAFAANPAKCRAEIERPASVLSGIIGRPVRVFGYPYGLSSAEAERLLSEQGYEWAFAAGNFLSPVDFSSPALDHFAVPRTIVYRWNLKFIRAAMSRRMQAVQAASKKPQI